MIEKNLIWILSLILIGLFSVIYIVSGIVSFKKNTGENYSFFKHFPHELSFKDDSNRKLYLAILTVNACMCALILINAFPFIYNFKSFSGFLFVEFLFAAISSISFVVMNLIEAKFIKQHTIIATLYMVSTFAMLAITDAYCFLLYSMDKNTFHVTIGILSSFLTLIEILTIINPKLKDWAKLESTKNDSGEIEYKRPRFFPLAYSEWITFVISTLGLILFLIALI